MKHFYLVGGVIGGILIGLFIGVIAAINLLDPPKTSIGPLPAPVKWDKTRPVAPIGPGLQEKQPIPAQI